ncbi:hypothetical protein HPP92_018010 [Vanilla planifolia]|uniref:Transcription factor IIIC subunit 5 HTH domain-containing protein n=1 Tax=Vanilla planifolia TaxID=51239 RepID=A0A835UNZ5_VANPL|nr:hypothetical protein HPP92_018010 [Vanilla planifolia]
MQKGAVEYCWEIPEKINWEDKLPKGTAEWKAQMALARLFEERPIWPRWSLYERLLDDGEEITDYLLRRLLLRTGYYFSRGPYGKFWIQKGYDPRTNSDSRIYQKVDFRVPSNLRKLIDLNENHELKHKWKDICKFLVWPSKACNVFQLFELDDDYIREEIEKSTTMTICSPLTGWFSEALLKALRLRVMIRFLSVAPKGPPEEFLNPRLKISNVAGRKKRLVNFGSQKRS